MQAQDTWIKTYDPFWPDVNYYFPEDIVVCQDGGYAVNGYYYYNDPELMIEEQWGFLMKTDCDGNLQWAKLDTLDFMMETKSLAFVETSDGGFISACSGGVLIKRDSLGNREWVIDEDFGINSMCNTADGNIILGGTQSLNIGLRKIDEEGNSLWTKVYPIENDYSICNSIIQTNDGGYALAGYIDYEGRQIADVLVMKTNVNGDSLWTRTFDGYGCWDRGKSITEDSNGNIMVAGELDDLSTLIGFLWYLDENGNTIWTQEVESSIGYSHYSVLSILDGSFTTICQTSSGAKLYNYDANYNLNWDNVFTGWSGRGDKPMRCLQNIGYVCCLEKVGGIFEDNIGIAKTNLQGQVVSIDEFEIPTTNEITLSNYPNPFNPETTIELSIQNDSSIEISIFNIKGQKIKTLANNEFAMGSHSLIWNGVDELGNSVSSGVYYYKLSVNGKTEVVKKCLLLK